MIIEFCLLFIGIILGTPGAQVPKNVVAIDIRIYTGTRKMLSVHAGIKYAVAIVFLWFR